MRVPLRTHRDHGGREAQLLTLTLTLTLTLIGRLNCLGTNSHLKEKFGNGYVVSIDVNQGDAGMVMKEAEANIKACVESVFAGFEVTPLKVHAGQLRYQIKGDMPRVGQGDVPAPPANVPAPPVHKGVAPPPPPPPPPQQGLAGRRGTLELYTVFELMNKVKQQAVAPGTGLPLVKNFMAGHTSLEQVFLTFTKDNEAAEEDEEELVSPPSGADVVNKTITGGVAH